FLSCEVEGLALRRLRNRQLLHCANSSSKLLEDKGRFQYIALFSTTKRRAFFICASSGDQHIYWRRADEPKKFEGTCGTRNCHRRRRVFIRVGKTGISAGMFIRAGSGT